jgi:hypothetical protein
VRAPRAVLGQQQRDLQRHGELTVKKVVAAAVAMAVVSTGVGLLLLRGGSPVAPVAVGSERAGSKDKQVEALGAEVAAVKAELARLERRAAGATRVEVPVADAGEQPARARDGAPRRQLETKEVAAAYAAHLAGEAVDARWSAQQESAIAAAFHGDVLQGSKLARVECRTSLCRMEVDHEGMEAEDRFAQAAPLTPPFNHGGFAQRVTDARGVHTIAFIAREGYELPQVD